MGEGDLESWTEVLEQAQAEVDAARERVERARVGRDRRGASAARRRDSLITAAHHTIWAWWAGRRSSSRLRRREREARPHSGRAL